MTIIIIIRKIQPTSCNISQFIYFCKTLYRFQLLMMEGETFWNMYSVLQK